MASAHLLVIGLLAGAVLAERPALAQTARTTTDPPPEGGASRGGPVLRLRVGPSYLSSTIGFNELADRGYASGCLAFAAEIGGSVSPHVTVCAELSGALAFDASATDAATLQSGGSPSADLSTAGLGPSFTYAFDPGNAYLATNPAFTIVRTSDPNHFFLAQDWGSNHFGVGIGFVVGGQWRVSSGWRLGAAAEARYAAVSGNGDLSTMSQYSLFFSATYG
jgi:hypothetical protein